MNPIDLKSLSRDEIAAFVKDLGWPAYRAHQLLQWIYSKGAVSFSEMTNLSKADRKRLEERAWISRVGWKAHQRSSDGTEKFLFGLSDGLEIESVLIPGEETDVGADLRVCPGRGRPHRAAPTIARDQPMKDRHRLTLCISTQVGCTLDCRFCLTGTMGLIRNLAAHEIVDQVLEVQRYLNDPSRSDAAGARRLTNIVLMGMGEPLANYREVVEALIRMTDPERMGISPRRITLSTAGLVPQIRKLGGSGLGVNLAVSLNATTDAVRERIMPKVHRLHPLNELMKACRDYPVPPRRRLTFEYVLLSGVNDTEEDARRLVKLVRGIRCKINLIPFNEFPESPYGRPSDEAVLRFQKVLTDAGLSAFIRKSRGRDILAACGQLRTEVVKKVPSVV